MRHNSLRRIRQVFGLIGAKAAEGMTTAAKELPGETSVQYSYSTPLPSSKSQCLWRFLFQFTAAGQLRIFTGFPLSSTPFALRPCQWRNWSGSNVRGIEPGAPLTILQGIETGKGLRRNETISGVGKVYLMRRGMRVWGLSGSKNIGLAGTIVGCRYLKKNLVIT